MTDSTANESTASIYNQLGKHTIYCGNLSPATTTNELKEIFKNFTISSVSIRKTSNDQYAHAFINFDTAKAASDAIKEYNYATLNGKSIILQPYTTSKSSYNEANIYVGNLPSNLQTKDLYDLFKAFGTIVTCKISSNLDGKSNGYGFVKYTNQKAAKKAILNCQGVSLGQNKLRVEPYNSERTASKKRVGKSFTTCFIKHFPFNYTKESLVSLLEKYGPIKNVYFPLKDDKMPVGFAHVDFLSPESAKNAVEGLHDKKIFKAEQMGKPSGFAVEPFYIQKNEKRSERINTFQEDLTLANKLKRNLYFKNVPREFSDSEILQVLANFGEVVDFHIADDKYSTMKKYGFVCYAKVEDAAIALEKSKKILLDGNVLEVSVYKNKLERENDYKNSPWAHGDENSKGELVRKETRTPKDCFTFMAPEFERYWDNLGVSTPKEFSDKILLSFDQETKPSIEEVLADHSLFRDYVMELAARNSAS